MLVKELVEALLKEDQESLVLKQNSPVSITRKYDGIYDIKKIDAKIVREDNIKVNKDTKIVIL